MSDFNPRYHLDSEQDHHGDFDDNYLRPCPLCRKLALAALVLIFAGLAVGFWS